MTIDVTQMIEPVANALAPGGGTLSDAWSAVIGDRVAAWRLRNAARLQLAVNAELALLGIGLDRTRIPERYAFAWFDEATKQDEPEIQQLFARLLARAAVGDEDAADRRHLEIVTRLTPMDARVLSWMFENGGNGHPSIDDFAAWKGVRDTFGEKSDQSLEHIVALGMFEPVHSIKQEMTASRWETFEERRVSTFIEELPDYLSISTELVATARGISLWAACGPAEQASAPVT